MKEKIELYKEVLNLEPSSKVFFPLARMLVKSGQENDAIDILRSGLCRHPEFIEARLLLVQILRANNRSGECVKEVASIVGTFSEYPEFWDVWSDDHGQREDIAVAIGYLAAAFKNPDLSLLQVLAHGLKFLKDNTYISDAPADAMPIAEPTAKPMPLASPASYAKPPDGIEEDCNLHTKSMAEILAEQGDFNGALAIYQELLTNAATQEEEADLGDRINTLSNLIDSNSADLEQNAQTPPFAAHDKKDRIKSLLEKLALRLERRAQT